MAASNKRKPIGRRMGGARNALSPGRAIHHSRGQEGWIARLRPKKRMAPGMASQEGRTIHRAAETLGRTARRKPRPGNRIAATIRGVVWLLAMANRYAPDINAS